MKTNSEIIARLKAVIDESGLSQRRFAQSLGLSPSTISEIFTNRIQHLSGSFITLIQLKHGISPEWLENGQGEKYTQEIRITDKEEIKLLQTYRTLKKSHQTTLLLFTQTLKNMQTHPAEKTDDSAPNPRKTSGFSAAEPQPPYLSGKEQPGPPATNPKPREKQ